MGDSKDIIDKNKSNIEVNAETRRIPKSQIEEMIRLDREKNLKQDEEIEKSPNPFDLTDDQEKTDNESSQTIIINKEALNNQNNKTANIPIENADIAKQDQSEKFHVPKNERPFNSDITFHKPPKQGSLTPWIVMVIIIIAAAIIFYSIGPSKEEKSGYNNNISKQNVSDNVQKEDIGEENILADDDDYEYAEDTENKEAKKITKPALLNKVSILETVNITNEYLAGESLKKIRKKGALLSEEDDPKIVAIVNGLIKRLEITNGVISSKSRGVTSRRWRGVYRGFKIDAQKKEKAGKIILNRIFLTTPSKAQISIIGGVLNSIKKINYETFVEELNKKGISIESSDMTDEQKITINLSVLPPEIPLSKDEFLLSASGIFGIKGGDGVERIKLNLPEGFRVIKKNIIIDEKTSYNVHKVHNKQFHPLFFVKEWGDKIATVEIISKRFKTKESIGINSTLGLMRIYFPNLKIAKTKTNLIIVLNEEIGGYFIIDSTVEDFSNLNFKDSTKIIKIVLE